MKTTIADMAKKAGVSTATISRVLNDRAEGVGAQTRARIKALIEETGFQACGVARGLATGKSRSVGLIIPDIANPFFPPLVRGIEDALQARGYSLFLCDSDRDMQKEKSHLRVLLEKRVDGILLSSTISGFDGRFRDLDERGVPYVLLDRVIDSDKAGGQVYLDNRKGARLAVEYLVAGGARRLLFINGPEELSISRLRREGVEEAFRQTTAGYGHRIDKGTGSEPESGLDPAGKPVTEPVSLLYREGDYTVAGGEAVVEAILGAPGQRLPFDAIFAGNDLMAIGALRACKRHRIRIPQQVQIIGFDDIELARLVEPPLSTIAQPTFEMGIAGAQLLLRLMDGEKPRRRTLVMEPRLVVRKTTRRR
ncbi:MAG: LacI family DNA-binding transcriptional regulator [Spirochaetota bacterium]